MSACRPSPTRSASVPRSKVRSPAPTSLRSRPEMRRAILAALTACALTASAAAGPLVQVTGVADNDSLNLRAQPDPNSARVGTIDAHDTKIEVIAVDTKGVDWVKVRKGNVSGWVNAKFLQYDTGAPVKMTCTGT